MNQEDKIQTVCPHCPNLIDEDATSCYHCGESVGIKDPKYANAEYKIGDIISFIDENQWEVKGEVTNIEYHEDKVVLRVKLEDNSGFYDATLMRN